MITIHNLRNEKPIYPYDVKVDRTSVLGNPFYMKSEKDRNSVCDMYEELINKPHTKEFNDVLNKLHALYKQHNKLRLFCWCSPKRCHAESIKRWILNN